MKRRPVVVTTSIRLAPRSTSEYRVIMHSRAVMHCLERGPTLNLPGGCSGPLVRGGRRLWIPCRGSWAALDASGCRCSSSTWRARDWWLSVCRGVGRGAGRQWCGTAVVRAVETRGGRVVRESGGVREASGAADATTFGGTRPVSRYSGSGIRGRTMHADRWQDAEARSECGPRYSPVGVCCDRTAVILGLILECTDPRRTCTCPRVRPCTCPCIRSFTTWVVEAHPCPGAVRLIEKQRRGAFSRKPT